MSDDNEYLRFDYELTTTTNRSLERKARWKVTANKHGYCSHCRPHRGMDQKQSRHGRTDRYKNHRRGPSISN